MLRINLPISLSSPILSVSLHYFPLPVLFLLLWFLENNLFPYKYIAYLKGNTIGYFSVFWYIKVPNKSNLRKAGFFFGSQGVESIMFVVESGTWGSWTYYICSQETEMNALLSSFSFFLSFLFSLEHQSTE